MCVFAVYCSAICIAILGRECLAVLCYTMLYRDMSLAYARSGRAVLPCNWYNMRLSDCCTDVANANAVRQHLQMLSDSIHRLRFHIPSKLLVGGYTNVACWCRLALEAFLAGRVVGLQPSHLPPLLQLQPLALPYLAPLDPRR